jgi:hypothetical protein
LINHSIGALLKYLTIGYQKSIRKYAGRTITNIFFSFQHLIKIGSMHTHVCQKSVFLSLILMCEYLFISINMQEVFHEK